MSEDQRTGPGVSPYDTATSSGLRFLIEIVAWVAVPGWVRLLVEAVLLVAAVAGAWAVWPVWAAVAVSVAGVAMLVAGMPRYR